MRCIATMMTIACILQARFFGTIELTSLKVILFVYLFIFRFTVCSLMQKRFEELSNYLFRHT